MVKIKKIGTEKVSGVTLDKFNFPKKSTPKRQIDKVITKGKKTKIIMTVFFDEFGNREKDALFSIDKRFKIPLPILGRSKPSFIDKKDAVRSFKSFEDFV